MTTGAVAAIDLGATSGRVIVAHIGQDTLELREVARFRNGPVDLGDGLHWDIVGLYDAAVRGLREALREEPGIVSVGIDSWAVDYALLRGGRMLGIPFHYRDERTTAGVAAVHDRMPFDELASRNGLQFLPFNTVYQLAAEDPALVAAADTMLLIPDLLAHWLTGATVAERTNASTTGLVDPRSGEWDAEILQRTGMRGDLLAPLVSPGDDLGPIRDGVLPVNSDVRVVAVGSHDTASAVVAVPMDPARSVYVSCGTWGLVGAETVSPVLTAACRDAGFTNEGGVDGTTRLLRNVMGLWILNETVRAWSDADGSPIDLPALLADAATITGDVPVFDVDDPRFSAPGEMTARIDAWFTERSIPAPARRAAYARVIIESLAAAFATTAARAAELAGIPLEIINVVGGGSLNELLCQRTADRAGVPVLAGPVEATAIGNVLVQARAHGFIAGSLADLRALVIRTHPPRRFDPR